MWSLPPLTVWEGELLQLAVSIRPLVYNMKRVYGQQIKWRFNIKSSACVNILLFFLSRKALKHTKEPTTNLHLYYRDKSTSLCSNASLWVICWSYKKLSVLVIINERSNCKCAHQHLSEMFFYIKKLVLRKRL